MAKYLLLAEKPSVMRDIQAVYEKNKSQYPFEMEFGAFHGHLMELAEADQYDEKYKKWTEADLPIIPNPFVYVEQDSKSCSMLMNKIKAGNYDALVNACDAGREGEHIFFSFYEAHHLTIPVLRFWASDTTAITVEKTLHNLRPASDFDGVRQAAKLRAQLDWLTGINFSRAVSLKTHKKANIGRVLSPTLKIIVDREREIQNFKAKDFYEVQGTFQASTGEYSGTYLLPPDNKQTRMDTQQEADAVVKSLGKTGQVQEVLVERKSQKAPTLYSTTELQKDASRLFGYSAVKTESLAQSLYEKHLTTYPRTECRFLPTAMIPELAKHLKPLEATPLKQYAAAVDQKRIDAVTATKDYIDNAKLTDHHAIIPTMDVCNDFSALPAEEQNIYLLICKRFLAIFMDPYITEQTTIFTDVDGKLFKTTGKVEIDKGYGVLFNTKTTNATLPKVQKGDEVTVTKAEVSAGKTTPPKRYTTATLLDAMAHAGNFVSSEESRKILREASGIGTGATRKDILAKLESTGMCTVKKTVFTPTEFGCALIDAIGNRMICSPEMTATWESKLREVESNSYKGDLKKEIPAYVTQETEDILNHVTADLGCYAHESLGKCPKCGEPVFEGSKWFLCSKYKKGCDFIVNKEYIGAKITKDDMKKLLEGKQTAKKHMTTKAGKQMEDSFALAEDGRIVPFCLLNKKSGMDGEVVDPSKMKNFKSLGSCPVCGGKIYEGSKFYLCTNKSAGTCSWTLSKEIRSAKITPKDVSDMLAGKMTSVHTFVWASGKSGQAQLRLKDGGKLDFVFPKR